MFIISTRKYISSKVVVMMLTFSFASVWQMLCQFDLRVTCLEIEVITLDM